MTKVQYTIEYQKSPGEGLRPIDDGEIVGIQFEDDNGFALIPNVGDFVNIGEDPSGQRAHFSGVVRSRSFFYQRLKDDETVNCRINIVVEHSNIDVGLLIKS
jgi:hypothetical protein